MSPIAQGAFSQVVRARQVSTRQEVAGKSFNKVKLSKELHLAQAMKNELEVLHLLGRATHPNVANLLETLDSKSSIHCVLEYCGGGSVQRYLKSRPHATGLPEPEVVQIVAQVASALAYMHGLGVCHRDVKPENMLFVDTSRSCVKLCDFGFAVVVPEGRRTRTVCGSPQYMAPELSRREPYHAWAVDVWALGCLIFELIEGRPAFRGSSLEQLNIRILRCSHESYLFTPAPARGLIKGLLKMEPLERTSARDVLAHGWLGAAARELAPPEDEQDAVGADPYADPADDDPTDGDYADNYSPEVGIDR